MRYIVYKRPVIVEDGDNRWGAFDWRPAHVGTLTMENAQGLETELKKQRKTRWHTKIEEEGVEVS